MPCVTPLRLAVALDGAGWHAAAARSEPWTDLVQEAERGKLDFVTIADSPESDAAAIAAEVAPQTSRIGLVPTVNATPPPTQISTAIATLDHVSSGRAGWQARSDQASDVVEAVRQLWDGLATPAPQGHPVVLTEADGAARFRFAADSADVVLVTPSDEESVRHLVEEVRAQEVAADRAGAGLRIFADLAVFLADTEAEAHARKARLDDLHGSEFTSGETVFVGTPIQLMRRLQAWQRAGAEGFRLHPAVLADDLPAITRGLIPALQENDAFRRGYEARSLRALLGLPRAVNRSAAVG